MDAVHHLTYERVGKEDLTDLQAICDFCHEYLSGKRNDDPATEGIRVYLAGPFTEDDWRSEIIASPPKMVSGRYDDPPADFPVVSRGLLGGFDGVGPWRITNEREWGEDDVISHGIVNAGDHHNAWACDWTDAEKTVVRLCKRAIARSHIVFAWLPDTRTISIPAGTLWELGYAAACENVTVVLARPTCAEDDDCWFARSGADIYIGGVTSPKAAWLHFLNTNLSRVLWRVAVGGAR